MERMRGPRADKDETSTGFGGNHRRYDGAGGVEGTIEIDCQDIPPVVVGKVDQPPWLGYAGTSNTDCWSAPVLRDSRNPGRHLGGVGYVDTVSADTLAAGRFR